MKIYIVDHFYKRNTTMHIETMYLKYKGLRFTTLEVRSTNYKFIIIVFRYKYMEWYEHYDKMGNEKVTDDSVLTFFLRKLKLKAEASALLSLR